MDVLPAAVRGPESRCRRRARSIRVRSLAGVHDAAAFGKVLDSIANRVNQYLNDPNKGKDAAEQVKKEADLPVLALVKLPAPDRGYQLTSPERLVPWLEPDEHRPTILVGRSFVANAFNLERARGGGGRVTG